MKWEIAECTLVFLVPLFLATILNNFPKNKRRANLKIVFYKFFLFCTILFFASQIPITIGDASSLGPVVRILGDLLMALLVLEFFLIPGKDMHPDDMLLIHNAVLWFVVLLFLVMCCFQHYPSIAIPENGWRMHPIYDIFKISKKIYTDLSLPLPTSSTLPICNLFSYVQK